MAHMICRLLAGSAASCAGWVCLIVATATNDWVRTCDYSVNTCVRMDELGSRGLWAECVVSTSLYHCVALNQIFSLPAFLQTCRALMIIACLLGLPAMLLAVTSMACVRLPNDTAVAKKRRAIMGGVFYLLMAACGIVATVWFPIGSNKQEHLMSFGFSLYTGWVGSGLCLLGGIVVLCCRPADMGVPSRDNSFYYSKQGGTATPLDPPPQPRPECAGVMEPSFPSALS